MKNRWNCHHQRIAENETAVRYCAFYERYWQPAARERKGSMVLYPKSLQLPNRRFRSSCSTFFDVFTTIVMVDISIFLSAGRRQTDRLVPQCSIGMIQPTKDWKINEKMDMQCEGRFLYLFGCDGSRCPVLLERRSTDGLQQRCCKTANQGRHEQGKRNERSQKFSQ